MSWKCSCGLINGGTNKYCGGALTWKNIEHEQVSRNEPDWIMAYLAAKELGMTPEEELYAKFFSEQMILCKDMDMVQLREKRLELQKIAFEAKARLGAFDETIKEKKAKANNREWLVTETSSSFDVQSAINTVAARKARMTKGDKLREQLKNSGLDDKLIEEMVGKVEQKATDSTLKAITFKPAKPKLPIPVPKPISTEPSKPFDPDTLFGKG